MKNSHIPGLWFVTRFHVIPFRMTLWLLSTFAFGAMFVVWGMTGHVRLLMLVAVPGSITNLLARDDFNHFKKELRVETQSGEPSTNTSLPDSETVQKIRDGIGRAA